TDIQEILAHGVMMTPALVVDGKVVLSGRVPTVAEAKQLLAKAG
ncbi:MAG: thioredoxin family protein, partial [Nitrospirae bacterium CG18_big_fil_WC_8_21_14_2_50_70_55]